MARPRPPRRARLPAAALLTAAVACGRGPAAPSVSRAWEVMGTVLTVAAWGADSAPLRAAVEAAFDSVQAVDSLLSTFRDDSEITAVNRGAGGGPRSVSATFAAVLGEAVAVARRSGGAFSPTLRELGGVWFDTSSGSVALAQGVALDFGGIAKGYALDRAALALAVADSAVLSFGGQVMVLHTGPGREIGIADPDQGLRLAAAVSLPGGTWSVSTSSQAEASGHLVDPRTGAAADAARSVTVIAGTATSADAWSTALFVLGCRRAIALGDSVGLNGVVCIDDAVAWTPGLDGRIALPASAPVPPPAPAPERAPAPGS